jgi:DNA-binding transcriptional ArsR family regulator
MEPQLNQTFSVLADTTRRAIIARLSQGEATLSEVADPFDMTLTAVSKHVRLLSDAGLVTVTKRGRTRYCRLEAVPMRDAVTWLNAYQKFWDDQFAALAQYVEEDDK